jgi:hypothetical protein
VTGLASWPQTAATAILEGTHKWISTASDARTREYEEEDMAFCENCGNQLSETAKFCASCGKPAGMAVSSAPSGSASAGTSARVAKIVVGAVGLFVLLAFFGRGVVSYLSHSVNKNADELAQGLPDMGALKTALPNPDSQPISASADQPASPASPTPSASLDPNKIITSNDGQCALFNKEELTRVLGATFTHADADATGCTYKGDAPRVWVRTEALWRGGRKPVQDKKNAYQQLSHNMPKANIPIQPYPGVGDEAWTNLWNVITARKGDAGITLDLRYYHDSDDLTKMMANAALARLGGG